MRVMGADVNGGNVYGRWPGLDSEALYNHDDLMVTTDYRQVLSEILVLRLGSTVLSQVFPGYSGYQPLGLVRGLDLPVQ
jgi:uncharacterized protein (DUF1501 family)